jgi:hypothetical protein
MPIQFACPCGRAFKVGDEHAGKRTKCPSCGAAVVVPKPEAEELEVEVIEAEVVEAEVIEAEVVEADRVTPAKGKPSRDDDYDEEPRKGRKKKRRRRAPDRGGPLSRMYEEQARRDMARDMAMARTADTSWGRDDDREGHGWTMFGVHITAGVLSGAGMLFVGLLATALIAIFKDDEEVVIGPRAYIASIVCTALGAIVLVKALFFGEED